MLKNTFARSFFCLAILVLPTSFMLGCAKNKPPQPTEAEINADWERRKALAAKHEMQEQEKSRKIAYAKEAGTRNAEKIKSLGFPPSFVNSTIYTQFLSRDWIEFMPASRWLGQLLENNKISSLTPISVHGNPGVLIKRPGQPGVGFVFRIENKEAFPYAVITNGETSLITPKEQAGISMPLLFSTNN